MHIPSSRARRSMLLPDWKTPSAGGSLPKPHVNAVKLICRPLMLKTVSVDESVELNDALHLCSFVSSTGTECHEKLETPVIVLRYQHESLLCNIPSEQPVIGRIPPSHRLLGIWHLVDTSDVDPSLLAVMVPDGPG